MNISSSNYDDYYRRNCLTNSLANNTYAAAVDSSWRTECSRLMTGRQLQF